VKNGVEAHVLETGDLLDVAQVLPVTVAQAQNGPPEPNICSKSAESVGWSVDIDGDDFGLRGGLSLRGARLSAASSSKARDNDFFRVLAFRGDSTSESMSCHKAVRQVSTPDMETVSRAATVRWLEHAAPRETTSVRRCH